jgi:outer membrane protein assembly factor BamA
MNMRWLLIVVLAFILFDTVAQSSGGQVEANKDSTELLTLNRVIIIGNKKTLDRIISRELSLKSSDTIRRYELEKILIRDKTKIYNLRIFNTVSIRALELPDKSFDLLIEVAERWFAFPLPIFELSDRNFNEWWENYNHDFSRVNYGLRLYHYNFRGRNETIRFTAQFGFSRRFDLTYRIPYIDKKQKQGLIFDVTFSEPKNLAYQTDDHILVFLSGRQTLRKKFGAGVTYTYRKSFYETHAVTLDYEQGAIADTIRKLNTLNSDPSYYAGGKSSQKLAALGYTFISEHRDVIAYPLKGYQVMAGIRHILFGSEAAQQTTAYASLAYHKDLGKKFFFSNFTTGFLSSAQQPPYSLYSGQGYQKKFVRGYEIYVIEGPWYVLNKATLKKRIFQKNYVLDILPWEQFQFLPVAIYLKAYADFGYTQNYSYYSDHDKNKRLTNKLIAGAGLGLDLVTHYDASIRLEYTMNKEGRHGFFFHMRKEF